MRRRIKDKRVWHKWFAWHPVMVRSTDMNDYLIFFETIERIYDRCGLIDYRIPSEYKRFE